MKMYCQKEHLTAPSGTQNADLLQVCGGLAARIPVLAEAIQPDPRYICLLPQSSNMRLLQAQCPWHNTWSMASKRLKAPCVCRRDMAGHAW